MAQGSEDIIDSYVDRAGVKGDTDFMVTQLNEVFTQFKKIKDLNIDLGGLQSFKAVGDSVKRLKVEMDELQRIELALIKTYEKRQAAFSNQAKDLALEKEYLRQRNNELRTSAKENIAAEGSLNQLRASLIRLRNEYDNLGKAQREAAKGQELLKSIQALDAEVKKLEADSGRFQRNVGNYASGFNGLSNSINQISREIPNFALSAQTGILALSNNIPILADEIARLRTRNAQLIAQGQPTVSVFRQIAGALFSWQTGLSLGITLITVFGKEIGEFVSSLFSAEDAVSDLVTKQRLLNEVSKEAADSYGKEKAELDVLVGTLQKEGISKQNKLALIKELQSKFPGYFDNIRTEADLNDKLSESYERASKAILLKATAQAAQDFIGKNASEIIKLRVDFENDMQNLDKQTADRFKKEAEIGRFDPKQFAIDYGREKEQRKQQLNDKIADKEKENKILLDIAIKANQDLNSLGEIFGGSKNTKSSSRVSELEKQLQAEFEVVKAQKERRIEIDKEIVDNEKVSYRERMIAFASYMQQRFSLLELESDFEREKKGLSEAEIKAIDQRKYNELIKIAQDGTKTLEKIQEDHLKATKKNNKDQVLEADDFHKRLHAIIVKATKDQAQAQKDAAKKAEDLRAETKKRVEQLVTEIRDLTIDLFVFDIDREKNQVQEQIDMLEQKKQKDIEVANQTIQNAQERANAIAIIEARAQAQREQLERRQRQLNEQKARFEKARAIAEIIQSTTIAVVKTLAEYPGPKGITLAAIIAAIGAVQLARTIAAPIPKYAKGTQDHKGGLAIVGDGGRKEYAITPDNKVYETPDKPTLVNLPKHTKVIPSYSEFLKMSIAADHKKISTITNIKTENNGFQYQNFSNDINRMRKDIVGAIKNNKTTIISKGGNKDLLMKHGYDAIKYVS